MIKSYEATSDFPIEIKKIIENEIDSFSKKNHDFSVEDKEDWFQELMTRAMGILKKEGINNQAGYILQTCRNYLNDQLREKQKRKSIFVPIDPDKIAGENDSSIDLFERKTPEELFSSEDNYQRAFTDEFKKGAEISLKFIEQIYEARNRLKKNTTALKWFKAEEVLEKTKERLKKIFRIEFKKEFSRYTTLREKERFHALSPEERKELEDMLGRDHELHLIHEIEKESRRANLTASFEHYGPDELTFLLLGRRKKGEAIAVPNFYHLCIEPPRLIFDVWKKARDLLKRGKYVNMKKMKLAFWYHKEKSKGTPQEFLFESIKDIPDIENLRQYQYRQPSIKFYPGLVKSIYKRSFKDKIDIRNPVTVTLWLTKEGKIGGQRFEDIDPAIKKKYL